MIERPTWHSGDVPAHTALLRKSVTGRTSYNTALWLAGKIPQPGNSYSLGTRINAYFLANHSGLLYPIIRKSHFAQDESIHTLVSEWRGSTSFHSSEWSSTLCNLWGSDDRHQTKLFE